MTRRISLAAALAGALTATGCGSFSATETPTPAPLELAKVWDAERVSPRVSPLVDHAEVTRRLEALRRRDGRFFTVEEIGRSVEGRSINHVTVGSGPFKVLLWSQMHGDEPTATSALFDLFEYLYRHRTEDPAARILDALTLHAVPMLNPDGAEKFTRRNAQGIDVNRDALLLQTPEGRALKALRDRLNPRLGFNLHNQNLRTSVGRPPKPAAISLLSVAYDEARTINEGRQLTRQVCVVIRDALEPLVAGQIGRYAEDFEVRAFGDNLTKWGTPIVLIETGPWARDAAQSRSPEDFDGPLIRLNFVALVTALDAIATGSVAKADPERYASLPVNESRNFFITIRGVSIVTGTGIPPFTGDIGLVATRRVKVENGTRELQIPMAVEDIGDLRTTGALETIYATGLTAAPLFDEKLKVGETVDLPDKFPGTITIGAPAAIVLLRPSGSRYVVERVIPDDYIKTTVDARGTR
ncbi:MAG TPA: M14 family zinc carboxypeptidase [Vicinamibacterales bacterium]|nr:M14 family zinc carboxypeptidase [Vicinamibacterales bacterium]